MRNCKRVKMPKVSRTVALTGWVGVLKNDLGEWLLFRPDRGSGGVVPYDTSEKARHYTGCAEVRQVQLQLVLL